MNETVLPAGTMAKRHVGFLLALGILLLPGFFAWILVREGYSTRARIIGFMWMTLILLAWVSTSIESDPANTGTGQTIESAEGDAAEEADQVDVIVVSARQLHAAYDANEISADQNYKGKTLEVTGIVESIGSDFSDEPSVNLSAGNEFGWVTASGLATSVAASLSKGQQVTLVCVGAGEVASFPMLSDCEMR